MIAQNSNILEKDLQQTANMLLLNGTLTECPGLIHGKMGITIFFSIMLNTLKISYLLITH